MEKALVSLILITGTFFALPLLAQDGEPLDGEIDFAKLVSLLPALFVLMFYFVPTIIAPMRDVKNYAKIFFVKLCFGWTVVGWVEVLIWSIGVKTFFGRRKQSRSRPVQTNQRRPERYQVNDSHTSTPTNEAPSSPEGRGCHFLPFNQS
jgi:hypothetical protein